MKVKELIKALEQFDPELEVVQSPTITTDEFSYSTIDGIYEISNFSLDNEGYKCPIYGSDIPLDNFVVLR